MAKVQRLLDPIHGLIRFGSSDAETHAWRLLNCDEFQRLRRVRQLGFSEFVYPGATHSRFAHSIGVFHNARKLLRIISDKVGTSRFNDDRAAAAMLAALLHDVGHGPFSHTFEGVERRRGHERDHESWTADVITGDTEIGNYLRTIDEKLPNVVADVIKPAEGGDIYSSVVSSQFDADRLDYLKRDRYMTGIGSGDFDMEWLLDCLEVGEITIGSEDDYVNVPSFFLNYKGYKTAETYLQARFQLYSMVYMHKTTRGAERMLAALLARLSNLLQESTLEQLGLPVGNAMVEYLRSDKPSLSQYLRLDDHVVWGSLRSFAECKDRAVSDLAARLLHRRLYKCVDIGKRTGASTNQLMRFRKLLHDGAAGEGLEVGLTVLEDGSKIGGYSWYDWDSESALKKVLVRDSEQSMNPVDIATTSNLVKALAEEKLYRVYVPDPKSQKVIESFWNEAAK